MKRVTCLAMLAFLGASEAYGATTPIELAVDATDIDHGIFTTHETIPAPAAGEMTLLYPQWEIGSHAPTASVADLAGLVIRIDGERVEWRRDPLNVYAFRLTVPQAAKKIDIDLQFLPPASANWLRPQMIGVQWHRMLLYPAGRDVRDISVTAGLKVPEGMKVFSAQAMHEATSLEKLIDSPAYAARHARQIELQPNVHLDLLADAQEDLAIPSEEIEKLKKLVFQAGKIFGNPPFRHYDAILTLSDDLSPGGGIEHLEESENFLPAGYFRNLADQLENRDLIAHELVHSWNGRFRLLWVYEGQTEFWGRVLAARIGMRSVTETLDRLALDAALVANRPGRAWKSLADSGNDAVYMAGHGIAWRDWQRREDYYPEGLLLWLDVEARLREISGGRRGLDDFARRFFFAGGTYSFEDVCAGLEAVAHEDWAGFLRRHLDSHDDANAIAGLARAGWRLVYKPEPTESFRQAEDGGGITDLSYSIGMQVRANGSIRAVAWNGPAFQAGLAPGVRISAVNGTSFSAAALKSAVASSLSLSLEIENRGAKRTVTIPYKGGLLYPRLERIEDTPDRLTPLLAPRI
jgi:predicted metalloprotease with PDZ domain